MKIYKDIYTDLSPLEVAFLTVLLISSVVLVIILISLFVSCDSSSKKNTYIVYVPDKQEPIVIKAKKKSVEPVEKIFMGGTKSVIMLRLYNSNLRFFDPVFYGLVEAYYVLENEKQAPNKPQGKIEW